MTDNKVNSLAKNTILLAIGNILTKGLLFVMIPFFSRWLSTEDYGSFDLFCTYVALLIPILTMATGEAMFRFCMQKDSTKEDIKKYATNCLFVVFINCTICTIILLGIRFIFNWMMAIPFILLLVGELYNNYLQASLRALKKLHIYSFSNAFIVVLITIFVTTFVRFLNMGLDGIIYGYALGYILGNLIISLLIKLHKYINIKYISRDKIKEMVKYSLPLIPNNISWWIVNVSDRLLIKFFIGITANGIYAIANKIPAICTAIFSVFNISWQQDASEIVENGDMVKIKDYFSYVYNSILAILLSICIVILSTNYILFNYIFDTKYITAHLYSPILITAIIFMLISQFYGGIQISFKKPKENGITTMIGAGSNILINLVMIKYFGLYAAAISTLISYIIVNSLRKLRLHKTVDIKINRKNTIIVFIYLYFLISSYYISNFIFSTINLILSLIIFIYINKKIILKFLSSSIKQIKMHL